MANIKSQIKRNRQSRKAAVRNKGDRQALKTLIIKFDKALSDKKKKEAQAIYSETVKTLDKAAASGLIHANRAASKKSDLSKRLAALK